MTSDGRPTYRNKLGLDQLRPDSVETGLGRTHTTSTGKHQLAEAASTS